MEFWVEIVCLKYYWRWLSNCRKFLYVLSEENTLQLGITKPEATEDVAQWIGLLEKKTRYWYAMEKYLIWNMICSLGWNSLWIFDAKTKRKNVFLVMTDILSPAFLLSVIMYTGIHQKLKYTWMSTLATLGEYRMMARHVLTILALRNIKKIINGNVLKVQYFQNSWSKSETNEKLRLPVLCTT